MEYWLRHQEGDYRREESQHSVCGQAVLIGVYITLSHANRLRGYTRSGSPATRRNLDHVEGLRGSTGSDNGLRDASMSAILEGMTIVGLEVE
jgi:hypothetical protein